jgi:hypothetical protein
MKATTVGVLAAVCLVSTIGVPVIAQSGRVRRPEPKVQAERTPEEVQPTPSAPPLRRPPAPIDATYEVEYVGGTVSGLERGEKIKLLLKNGKLMLAGKSTTHEVPIDRVTEMAYGQSVRDRTAEGVGVGVLVPVAGEVLRKMKTTAHYVEIMWQGPPTGGAVIRADKDDYRELLVALEQASGLEVKREAAPLYRDIQP